MQSADHKSFAREWVEAWNSHDLDRILSHYEEDVVLTSPRARVMLGREDGCVRGTSDLRQYFSKGLQSLPDLKFTLERVYSGVNSVVLEYCRNHGPRGAELMEFGPSGRVCRVIAHYVEG
ncbi:MAG TPA: nuclear transport factor 2 family protein [Micropepsaceae bacterium]|nr:nuclear transport factor 2 family protein [Micropepsaceae bacterium]